MAFGFGQPIGSTPSLADAADAPLLPSSEVLGSFTQVPAAYYITKDSSAFEALVFSFVYLGNPVFPAATGDYVRIQVLWYSSDIVFSAANLLWVDTFEVSSRQTPGHTPADNKTFVHLPVRGKVCVLSFNSPATGGANPMLNVTVLGSTKPLSKSIFTSDQNQFGVTDNILLQINSAVAVGAGAAGPWFFGGLQSGPVTTALQFTVGAGAATGVILQTAFGSSAVGLPELTLTTVGIAGVYRTSATGQYTARRPIRARIVNNGPATVTAYNVNIVRDEP